MHFVAIKTPEQSDLLSLHRVRSRLIRQRTAIIHQIRGFLLERGISRCGKVQCPTQGVARGLKLTHRGPLAALGTSMRTGAASMSAWQSSQPTTRLSDHLQRGGGSHRVPVRASSRDATSHLGSASSQSRNRSGIAPSSVGSPSAATSTCARSSCRLPTSSACDFPRRAWGAACNLTPFWARNWLRRRPQRADQHPMGPRSAGREGEHGAVEGKV